MEKKSIVKVGVPKKGSADMIDKVPVVAGRLIKVKNSKRPKFTTAGEQYYATWVEGANGKQNTEECLLFTESQINVARARAAKNVEDLTSKTFWTDMLD